MRYFNNLDAQVFDQTAAEDHALYIQSFAMARFRLNTEVSRRMEEGEDPKSFYIITDCDETILDNSPYNGWLVETGRDFHDDTWRAWCKEKLAIATPGAVEFMKYAAKLGVSICYVTSRFEDTRNETAENLRNLGFPLPDSSNDPATSFLFLSGMIIDGVKTKKDKQFAYLGNRFGCPPIVQLGDNLSDHDAVDFADNIRFDQRVNNAVKDEARWGYDWIVFPNAVYGSWRRTLRELKNGVDTVVADEEPPPPFQPQPVREPVTLAEAGKLRILNRWKPAIPIQ